MRDFKDLQNTVRQFLLAQLTERESAAIEDRIFAERDFAEEVQIIEDELIADYRDGNMRADDRVLFEARYLKSRANAAALEVEEVLSEFIPSKPEVNVKLSGLEPSEPLRVQTIPESPEVTSESRETWLSSVFGAHRAFAFAVLLAGFLLAIVVVWLLFGPATDNSLLARRQEIEAELALLNTAGSTPREKLVSTVDLQPSERNRGAMARIEARPAKPDELIEFRLNLTQAGTEKYRAVFIDDHQNELFSVPNLTAHEGSGSPRIQLIVPQRYLKPGDYQITLSVTNKNGGYDEIVSYSFRVVESKS
ncbi:MAG: hypothetical protein WAM70_11825 [Pyrinomonadaceae bacterium]